MSQVGEQTTATVAAPLAKITTAWTGVWASINISSWTDLSAAFTALAAGITAMYTLALLAEWMWKKAIRPYCEYRGWINRKQRRRGDFE